MNIKIYIYIVSLLFLSSCFNKDIENTGQNDKIINNLEEESYFETNDTGEFTSDSGSEVNGSASQNINSTGENPLNL